MRARAPLPDATFSMLRRSNIGLNNPRCDAGLLGAQSHTKRTTPRITPLRQMAA